MSFEIFLVSRKASMEGGVYSFCCGLAARGQGGANVSFDKEAANEASKDKKIAGTSTPRCGKKMPKAQERRHLLQPSGVLQKCLTMGCPTMSCYPTWRCPCE